MRHTFEVIMKILVLGTGAKDTAITWWFSKSKQIEGLYMAPGSPSVKDFAINLPEVDISDPNSILSAAQEHDIDLVFIGTETPLKAGAADILIQNGIAVCGAPLKSLKLESDRVFARNFAKKYKISFPDFRVFDTVEDLSAFLDSVKDKSLKYAVKLSEMTNSKEVYISSQSDKIVMFAKEHSLGRKILLERYMEGTPLTLTTFIDGKTILPLPLCSEYVKREHSDKSIVTGGMGAVCPVPLEKETVSAIYRKIVNPTLEGLKKEKMLFKGIITFSMVLSDNEPTLIDYHLRLNDPATQCISVLVKNDLCDIMRAMLETRLSEVEVETSGKSSVGCVVAAEGYPAEPLKSLEIGSIPGSLGLDTGSGPCYSFLGAVEEKNGVLYTAGGRVATIVGIADNIMNAAATVYSNIDSIKFPGAWYRRDIGEKFYASYLRNNE